MKYILYDLGQKERIKDIIKSCFNEKHITLSPEEIEQEYNTVIKHININIKQ